MNTEKYFVLYVGVYYEPGQLIGIFSSLDEAEDHIKSGNALGGDYYDIRECEVDKPFLNHADCSKAVRFTTYE